MDASPTRLTLPAILDGGMITELWKQGMPQEACVAQWAAEHEQAVCAVQEAYLQAGARVLVTPNFGGSPTGLEPFGLADQAATLNRRVAENTKNYVAGRALVAGGLSGLGRSLQPAGDADFEELVDIYIEQAAALEPFVDLFFIETMTELHEARAAAIAIRSLTDKPFFVSVACNGEGRLHGSGVDVLAALIVMQGLGAAAFGIGCTPVSIVAEQCERLAPYAMIPLLAKPCGEAWSDEQTVALAHAGVRMFGGCCDIGPSDIAAVKKTVSQLDFTQIPIPDYTSDPDVIACASGGEAQFITPDVDVGEAIMCRKDMLVDILAAEEDPIGAMKIAIHHEEDLQIFAENQYAVRKALCFETDEPELLEGALRVFQGRAFYDGLSPISHDDLARLKNQYGLVLL